ncbi:hypothetical protein ACXDF8_20340 [Mycolicibacterium sp. CBM1]
MDQHISPAFTLASIASVAALLIGAAMSSVLQSRRDRAERVVATWSELRITNTFLILGQRRNARRIPLIGLTASVTETAEPGDGSGKHLVHVTVEGLAEGTIRRSQPYSYGSIGAARTFEILLNRAGRRRPALTVIVDRSELPHAA